MMTKVFDLLRSLGWYLTSFIYDLIDGLLQIIKELNAFDIINSLSSGVICSSRCCAPEFASK